MVRKTRHMTYMNKYIVMFSYENMMSAHIPIFAGLLLYQNIVVDTCNCNWTSVYNDDCFNNYMHLYYCA